MIAVPERQLPKAIGEIEAGEVRRIRRGQPTWQGIGAEECRVDRSRHGHDKPKRERRPRRQEYWRRKVDLDRTRPARRGQNGRDRENMSGISVRDQQIRDSIRRANQGWDKHGRRDGRDGSVHDRLVDAHTLPSLVCEDLIPVHSLRVRSGELPHLVE